MAIDLSSLLADLELALEAAIEPGFQARQQHFSKEEINSLGVRTPVVREIAKNFYPQVKAVPFDEFLEICRAILMQKTIEHRNIAFAWAFRRKKELESRHFEVLFGWLNDFVSNWTDCDQLCCEVFGHFLIANPQFYPETKQWAASSNRWLRRACTVILIPELRKTCKQLPLLFELVEILIQDKDDLVQKGYGWALKVASQVKQAETFVFILQHRNAMPRTALRYAIEKLSPAQKAEALGKN